MSADTIPASSGDLLITMQFIVGLFLALVISGLAYRYRALSVSGASAAVIVGTVIFGSGGWQWGLLLIAFFVSSSVLSYFQSNRKEALTEKFAKGNRRDAGQVLANGGLGALLAIGYALWPHPGWWWAWGGAIAAMNADTWATELGVLSPLPPRLISSWKTVERGTSGGITPMGTLAAAGGAGFIGMLAAVLNWPPSPALFFALTLAGLVSALGDSLLGAIAQATYFCERCGKETERHPRHTCGSPTQLRRGWWWLNNDGVNFISSVIGALLALMSMMSWQ